MGNIIRQHPTVSLIATALLCGLLWRGEVEYRGWAGLLWLTYFHSAIPAGFALFLLWANQCIDMEWRKKVFFNLVAVFYGVCSYFAFALSLGYAFAGGSSTMLATFHAPAWLQPALYGSSFLLMLLLPVGTHLIVRVFQKKVPLHFLFFAIIGMLLSVPLSIVLLQLLHHKGGHDTIHAIKSGMLIPFWVFSLGLLIIGQRQPTIILADNTEQ